MIHWSDKTRKPGRQTTGKIKTKIKRKKLKSRGKIDKINDKMKVDNGENGTQISMATMGGMDSMICHQ